MLIGLNPLLSPDLLYTLGLMGHGDEIAVVDANFPASSYGDRVIRLDGLSATEVVEAILSVMPLDDFVGDPAHAMEPADNPGTVPEPVTEFQAIIDRTADHPVAVSWLERFAFYGRSKGAYAIVQTGERRLYGNLILKKGVVRLPAARTSLT